MTPVTVHLGVELVVTHRYPDGPDLLRPPEPSGPCDLKTGAQRIAQLVDQDLDQDPHVRAVGPE
jgi:hypothetical protein